MSSMSVLARVARRVTAGPRWAGRRPAATTAVTAAPFVGTKLGPSDRMHCMQCEQTERNSGCTTIGVCGKTPDVAALQDNLVYALKGLSAYHAAMRASGAAADEAVDHFTGQALFATMTNVNFDADRIVDLLRQTDRYIAAAAAEFGEAGKVGLPEHAKWRLDTDSPVSQGQRLGHAALLRSDEPFDADVLGMKEMVTYGLKGMCAYAEHARVLGSTSQDVSNFVHRALAQLADDKQTVPELVNLALEVGAQNVNVLAALDGAHDTNFGTPTPRTVTTAPREGDHAILVSGHDVRDLENILKATAGKNIDVYTHGELLPAHAYPEINKYEHLAGHFGGAWQLQRFDFSEFPGPIVVTTNCLIEPRKKYADRIYSHSVVGHPAVKHIASPDDFSEVIAQAQKLPGFDAPDEDDAELYPDVTVGFGHKTVLGIADKVLDAVAKGEISRFVVMGGCDGVEGERSYYTNMARELPDDAVILTLGCAKFRFNKLNLGTVPSLGIPRLLDLGQCNDAYSAVKIATGLADALKVKDLNDLPLSLVVSWFEQKAVAVFLSLLHLGIKNIYLGPALPAFATPNIVKFLVDNYQVHPIGTVGGDLAQMNINPRSKPL